MSEVTVVRAIELRGPFTDAEIADLIAWVRKCDIADPRRNLSIAVVAEEATLEQMERVVREGLPEREDRVTVWLNDRAETRPWLMQWLRRMWWDLP